MTMQSSSGSGLLETAFNHLVREISEGFTPSDMQLPLPKSSLSAGELRHVARMHITTRFIEDRAMNA